VLLNKPRIIIEIPLLVIRYVLIIVTHQNDEIYETTYFIISDIWLPSFALFSVSMLLLVVVWHCWNNIDSLSINDVYQLNWLGSIDNRVTCEWYIEKNVEGNDHDLF
jgi:hypothetical protein